MSVSNGELADANNFNTSFVSRQDDSNMEGVLALDNTSSGGIIANTQQAINTNIANILQNANNIAQNVINIAANATAISNLTANDIDETLSRYWDIKNNHSAAINPTINDDLNANYVLGSMWYNTTNNNIFLAIDVSSGAAVWENITNPTTHYFGTMVGNDWPDGTWRMLDVAGKLTMQKKVLGVWTLFADFGE